MTTVAAVLGVPVAPGDILADKYAIEQIIGAGGMGVVVAARHIELGGRVALKFLREDEADDPESAARFLREARAATQIKSEHVARVMDLGKHPNGAPYMVMEFLEGSDLGALLHRSGPLPIPVALDYAMQAMEALAEAHGQGIVHRDLKPSNLFVTRRADGSPLIKVLDFGISKACRAAAIDELTNSSVIIGSPMYMSPEQVRSAKDVDARADIWSLGVVLYELLTGKRPFQAETHSAVLAAIVSERPRPMRSVRDDIPPRLEAVIMRCLAKLPRNRFDNVAELADELVPFGNSGAVLSASRIRGAVARSASDSDDLADGPLLDDVLEFQTTATHGPWGSNKKLSGGAFGRSRSKARTAKLAVGAALLLLAAGVVGAKLNASDAAPEVIASAPAPVAPATSEIPLPLAMAPLPPAPAASATASTPATAEKVARPIPKRASARLTPKPAKLSEESALSHR